MGYNMLEPSYLLRISEGAEEIAEQLHIEIMRRMVRRIMERLGRGDDYILTATDKWHIENLQQAGYLLEDIQKEIAKATKLQEQEILEAMEDAGVKALSYDDKIYQSVSYDFRYRVFSAFNSSGWKIIPSHSCENPIFH